MTQANNVVKIERIKTRDITQSEWDEAEWLDVRTFSDQRPIFVRGMKHAGPKPNDGFAYVQVADIKSGAWVWQRAQTTDPSAG